MHMISFKFSTMLALALGALQVINIPEVVTGFDISDIFDVSADVPGQEVHTPTWTPSGPLEEFLLVGGYECCLTCKSGECGARCFCDTCSLLFSPVNNEACTADVGQCLYIFISFRFSLFLPSRPPRQRRVRTTWHRFGGC